MRRGRGACWVLGSLAVPPLQLLVTLRALHRSPGWLAQRLLAPLLARW